MTLEYNFRGETFPYDVEIDEYVDSLSISALCQIAKEIYNEKLSDEAKAKLKEEHDIESADSFDNSEDYDVISAAKDVFFAVDDNDIMDIQGDDIKKFFEDEAVDAFVDSHMDSYEYNGVSPSDFQ